MKNLKLISFFLLLISISVVSCSKGTAGPAGPAGPPGPSNVQHTAWTVLNMAFEEVDANGDSLFFEGITASSITQTVLDSGLVLSYLQNPDGSIEEVSDLSIFLDVEYALNTINITSYGIDLSNIYSFRYVIIPGTALISSSLRGFTKAQLKSMSYNSISKLLGIDGDKPSSN
jgi:hypothetical protein